MASNKLELALEIEALFSDGEEVTTKEQAAAARKRLATALADKIDAYVQYQIGLRLEGILSAVEVGSTPVPTAGATTTVGAPLVQGRGFSALTRKK